MQKIMSPTYVTEDGKKFTDEDEAKAHERSLMLTRLLAEFFHHAITPEEVAAELLSRRDALYRALA